MSTKSIRERLQNASPGPWVGDADWGGVDRYTDGDGNGQFVSHLALVCIGGAEGTEADVDFIAHSHLDLILCVDAIHAGAAALAALNDFIVLLQSVPEDDPMLMAAFRLGVERRNTYTAALLALEEAP
jgi:hypothetical protein